LAFFFIGSSGVMVFGVRCSVFGDREEGQISDFRFQISDGGTGDYFGDFGYLRLWRGDH
jgi:hypothetical protein